MRISQLCGGWTPLGRVPQLCCAYLHSSTPCGQKSSSGGPSLPKGTSEDRCWQPVNVDNPLFNCLFSSSRVQVWVEGHSAGPQSSIATTNTCCLLLSLPGLAAQSRQPVGTQSSKEATYLWATSQGKEQSQGRHTVTKPYRRAPDRTHTRFRSALQAVKLPQLWLKMPMLHLQNAERGTAAKAPGCSGSGTACTTSPHTSSARAPLSKWEGWGFPSPDAEQSPCVGLMIHSSSTVQGWSRVVALTHEQPVVRWAPSARWSREKPTGTLLTNLPQEPSHGPSTCSDQYLKDGDSIKGPSPMHWYGASSHPIWPRSEGKRKAEPCTVSWRSVGSGLLGSLTKALWQVISLIPDVETILFNTSLK